MTLLIEGWERNLACKATGCWYYDGDGDGGGGGGDGDDDDEDDDVTVVLHIFKCWFNQLFISYCSQRLDQHIRIQ